MGLEGGCDGDRVILGSSGRGRGIEVDDNVLNHNENPPQTVETGSIERAVLCDAMDCLFARQKSYGKLRSGCEDGVADVLPRDSFCSSA
jgi:hypothetical protein